MEVRHITHTQFADGRAVSTNSAEFRAALPISAQLLDELAAAESSGKPLAGINAIASAIISLEMRLCG